MPSHSRLVVALALLLAAPLAALAQSPSSLSYQGYLESGGLPVANPSATLTFRLFSDPTGGSELWTETRTGVAIANGLFTTDLGTTNPLGPELFFGPLYVSVAVGGTGAPQLSPRTALRAAPYARSLVAPAQLFGDDAQALLSIQNIASGSTGNGLYAETSASAGRAVYGLAGANSGANAGVYGQSQSQSGFGVFGTGTGVGIYALSPLAAIRGESTGNDNRSIGVEGSGFGYGIFGSSPSVGVAGSSPSTGVFGSSPGIAVLGNATSATGYAGYFDGRVSVTGTLTKGGGAFQIDHPLAPATRILRHSFVESPDMMNVYNGNVTTDAQGFATVELPAYFETLNRDFRYQLTVLGQFAQAIVSGRVAGNRFVIQTDQPNVEVSWQVTGIRQDAWANENRIVVEEDKPASEQGRYLHPSAFGLPREQGVDYDAAREAQMEQARPAYEAMSPPAFPRDN